MGVTIPAGALPLNFGPQDAAMKDILARDQWVLPLTGYAFHGAGKVLKSQRYDAPGTYGIERLAMYLQGVENVYDLTWTDGLTYGDVYHQNEVEQSTYNFEHSNVNWLFQQFNDYESEAKRLMELAGRFSLPVITIAPMASSPSKARCRPSRRCGWTCACGRLAACSRSSTWRSRACRW